MEANELRIGNWIIDNEVEPQRTVYYQVEEITYKGVVYRDGSSVTMCEYLQPIPLTEEILLKCGFTRDGFGLKFDFIYLTAGARIVETDELRCFDYELIEDKKYIRIKYLHQLQNLYFALTSEELNIKL